MMSINETRQQQPALQIDHLNVAHIGQQVEFANRLDPIARDDDDARSRTSVHRLDSASDKRPSHPLPNRYPCGTARLRQPLRYTRHWNWLIDVTNAARAGAQPSPQLDVPRSVFLGTGVLMLRHNAAP